MAGKGAKPIAGDPPTYDHALRKHFAATLPSRAVAMEAGEAVRRFREELVQVTSEASSSPDRRALALASLTTVIRLLNRLGFDPEHKAVFYELR
jgi:hypothetical protein